MKRLVRFAIFLLLAVTIFFVFTQRQHLDADVLTIWIQGYGLWAALIFMGIYAGGTILFLPGSLMTITGGLLFGPVWGTLYNLTGATLGATLSFLISRYLASDWVISKTGPRLKRIIDGIEAEGWRFVAFVRLVPVFPFNLLNYTLGLTRIKLIQYVIVTFFCMIPGALAYTYLGAVGKGALEENSDISLLAERGIIALGLMATVFFLPRVIKRMRKTNGSIKDDSMEKNG